MTDKLIINVALTGCVHPAGTPNLPTTPAEVAADARRCADAGATMFHLHARDGRGNPTLRGYGAYVEAVRAELGPGAVLVLSASGRRGAEAIDRARVCDVPGADMVSVSFGSFNHALTNELNRTSPALTEHLLRRAYDAGKMPECEVFDVGHAWYLTYLADRGHLCGPVYANVMLGNLGTAPAGRDVLKLIVKEMLPPGTVWAAGGVGRYQWRAVLDALDLGGHVRVGLEDNLWWWKRAEKLHRTTNVEQVQRVVDFAREYMDREPATFAEARAILGLEATE